MSGPILKEESLHSFKTLHDVGVQLMRSWLSMKKNPCSIQFIHQYHQQEDIPPCMFSVIDGPRKVPPNGSRTLKILEDSKMVTLHKSELCGNLQTILAETELSKKHGFPEVSV